MTSQPRTDLSQAPVAFLQPTPPSSVFLSIYKTDAKKLKDLTTRATPGREPKELCAVSLQAINETVPNWKLNLHIEPKLFFLPELDWVVLALFVTPRPSDGSSTLRYDQLLAFNSKFRFCQGAPERQDTDTEKPTLEFRLSNSRWPSALYEEIITENLGHCEVASKDLKKAVTLSFAVFNRPLDDRELYLFGTIAHEDEIADFEWASGIVREQAFERWRSLGSRYFVHSYSLVYACTSKSTDNDLESKSGIAAQRFLQAYAHMGVRIALQRAALLEFRSALKSEMTKFLALRRLQQTWVEFRLLLGMRWTAEGTQRSHIEQLWRRVSGINNHTEEIAREIEQLVDFFEAQATDQLNRRLNGLQVLFSGLALGQVASQLVSDMSVDAKLEWTGGAILVGVVLGWLVLQLRRRK